MDITKDLYNKVAADYVRELNKVNVTKPLRNKFITYAKEGKIIDLGCGPGFDTGYFAKKFDATGIDFSEEMIEIARRRFPSCRFVCQDMRKIEFRKDSIDGVWASQSIHHIPKKDAIKLLKKLKRCMKNEGTLFLSFRGGAFEGVTDKSKTNLFSGKKRFIALYTVKEIKNMMKSLHYSIIEMQRVKRRHGGEVFINVFAKNIK